MIALTLSLSSSATETNLPNASTKTNGPTLDVRSYIVEDNTVLGANIDSTFVDAKGDSPETSDCYAVSMTETRIKI